MIGFSGSVPMMCFLKLLFFVSEKAFFKANPSFEVKKMLIWSDLIGVTMCLNTYLSRCT